MMNRTRIVAMVVCLLCLGLDGTAMAKQGDVVVSIKPIHSLVAAVMDGVAVPQLIVQGAGSPHTYSMRPSQAGALENAKLVFWVGPGLEHFLERPLSTLAGSATIIELDKARGLTTLPLRAGGTFEPDDDGDGAHEGSYDPHLWLDPVNAEAMVDAIRAALVKADPTHAQDYEDNAQEENTRLSALIADIEKELAPVKGKPFVVFHDAYQYFEKRFDLHAAGSITVSPEVMPGAGRLSEIHEKIARLDAACVFAEPEFEPKFLSIVTEGTNARTGILDPLGAGIADGPDLYFKLIGNLSSGLRDCFAQ